MTTDANGDETAFVYTTYIQASAERVWQGLTDPALMKRYWRHQKAGPKAFVSDWKKGSRYDMNHDEVGRPPAEFSLLSPRDGPRSCRV